MGLLALLVEPLLIVRRALREQIVLLHRRLLAVNFQEVVHSAPAVNADVARQAVIRGGTEWTLTRMRL